MTIIVEFKRGFPLTLTGLTSQLTNPMGIRRGWSQRRDTHPSKIVVFMRYNKEVEIIGL